MAIIQTPN